MTEEEKKATQYKPKDKEKTQGKIPMQNITGKVQETPQPESKSLSNTFTAALTNFLPIVAGGLFEGSEGAVSAYKGAQQGIDSMQGRDLKERGMRVRERMPDIQLQQAQMRLDDPLRRQQYELGVRRADIAEKNTELRGDQLDLMRIGEERRGTKQTVDLGEKPIVRFESAPEVKAARGTISATMNADSLIDEALGNPVASAALPTQLARLAGQVGVLTDRDVDVYGTPGSIANKLEQIAKNMAEGTLTEQNAKFMRDLSNTMKQNAENIITGEADRFSSQYGTILNRNPEELKQFLLSGKSSGETQQEQQPQQPKMSVEQRRSRLEELRRKKAGK